MAELNDFKLEDLLYKNKKNISNSIIILLKDKRMINDSYNDIIPFTIFNITDKLPNNTPNRKINGRMLLESKKVNITEIIFFEEKGKTINIRKYNEDNASILINISHKIFYTFLDENTRKREFSILKRIISLKVGPIDKINNMTLKSLNKSPENSTQELRQVESESSTQVSNQESIEENLLGAEALPSYEENLLGAEAPPSYHDIFPRVPQSEASSSDLLDDIIKDFADLLDLLYKDHKTSINLQERKEAQNRTKELEQALYIANGALINDHNLFNTKLLELRNTRFCTLEETEYCVFILNIINYINNLIYKIHTLKSKNFVKIIAIKQLFEELDLYKKMKSNLDKITNKLEYINRPLPKKSKIKSFFQLK